MKCYIIAKIISLKIVLFLKNLAFLVSCGHLYPDYYLSFAQLNSLNPHPPDNFFFKRTTPTYSSHNLLQRPTSTFQLSSPTMLVTVVTRNIGQLSTGVHDQSSPPPRHPSTPYLSTIQFSVGVPCETDAPYRADFPISRFLSIERAAYCGTRGRQHGQSNARQSVSRVCVRLRGRRADAGCGSALFQGSASRAIVRPHGRLNDHCDEPDRQQRGPATGAEYYACRMENRVDAMEYSRGFFLWSVYFY